jgi:molecular chaperone DnaK
MVKDAEANAADDKKRKDAVEAKNQAEGLIHSTQKSLADLGDKAPPADKAAAEAAITELKAAIEGGDAEVTKEKTTALAQASMKIGEAMYKQSGGGAAGGAGPDTSDNPGADHDDIVDADFEEVKDDDKKA